MNSRTFSQNLRKRGKSHQHLTNHCGCIKAVWSIVFSVLALRSLMIPPPSLDLAKEVCNRSLALIGCGIYYPVCSSSTARVGEEYLREGSERVIRPLHFDVRLRHLSYPLQGEKDGLSYRRGRDHMWNLSYHTSEDACKLRSFTNVIQVKPLAKVKI